MSRAPFNGWPKPCKATIAHLRLAGQRSGGACSNWHVERVGEAVKLILAGDLYQVDLARRLDVLSRAFDVFDAMTKRAGGAFRLPRTRRERSVVDRRNCSLTRCGHAGRFERLATEPIKEHGRVDGMRSVTEHDAAR